MWWMRSVAKLRLTNISFKLIPQMLFTTVNVPKYAAYIFNFGQMLGFKKKKKFKLPDSKMLSSFWNTVTARKKKVIVI